MTTLTSYGALRRYYSTVPYPYMKAIDYYYYCYYYYYWRVNWRGSGRGRPLRYGTTVLYLLYEVPGSCRLHYCDDRPKGWNRAISFRVGPLEGGAKAYLTLNGLTVGAGPWEEVGDFGTVVAGGCRPYPLPYYYYYTVLLLFATN